jgi:beta-glucanase (GH16 family)
MALRLFSCLYALTIAANAATADFKLVLEENFEGTSLNPKIWNIETGKRKDAYSSAEAVDVRNGNLVITTWTNPEGKTLCGFVTTRRKVELIKGKLEVRCRFNVLPGTQVAFWAQSQTYGKSGKAAGATTDGVEIDIMETTGMMKGEYQYALHWGPYGSPTEKRISAKHFKNKVGAEWHTYGVEWDDTGYRFSRDGQMVATDVTCPASGAPQFILLTSESTLKSWNGERPVGGYGSKSQSTNLFEVDWVKAWERTPK